MSVSALWLRHRHHHLQIADGPVGEDEGGDKKKDRWQGFEAGHDVPAPPAADGGAQPRDWYSKEVTPDRVPAAMEAWRTAILEKRREEVLDLDGAFAGLPATYGPALLRLAETDPDERVRAFSVRVLGKMKNLALVDDFRRLLEDRSEFVRGNAAWALGELAKRPGGREAAEGAFDELRQAESDPATAVRVAATNALKALQ
ncbi:MAG TPA: HEAT repeat domain-containing protein [Polyangia bacterium]|nr:HEAT repeat domain-containing protein [Polyangia bacterium]